MSAYTQNLPKIYGTWDTPIGGFNVPSELGDFLLWSDEEVRKQVSVQKSGSWFKCYVGQDQQVLDLSEITALVFGAITTVSMGKAEDYDALHFVPGLAEKKN